MAVLTHQAQNSGTSTTNSTTLAIVGLTATVPIGDTAFVVVAGTASASTCVDNSANAGTANVWTKDGTMNSAGVGLSVFRSNITRSLSTGNTITITFAATIPRKAAVVFSTHGWLTPAAVERSATATGTTAAMSTGTTTATTKADEFVLAAYGISTTATPSVTDTSGMTRGATASALATAIAKVATYSWKETSATGTQAGSANVNPVTDWAGLILTYPAVAGSVFAKTITGAASFTSVPARPKAAVQRKQVAGVSFSGARSSSPSARLVSAGFTPSGALARQLSLFRTLTAAVSFGGAMSSAAARLRSLTGAVFTPAGTNTRVKAVSKSLTGALSFVGSQTRVARKLLTGGLAATGILSRNMSLHKSLVIASLTPTGSVKRLTSRILAAASITMHGAVTVTNRPTLAATLHPTGSISNGLPARTLYAVLSFSGSVARFTARQLVASLVASGVMHTQYLPPSPTPNTGGGGYGALMADSHFQRYQVARAWRNVKRVRV